MSCHNRCDSCAHAIVCTDVYFRCKAREVSVHIFEDTSICWLFKEKAKRKEARDGE